MLGTAAQGEHEMLLCRPGQDLLKPVTKRLQAAKELAEACVSLAEKRHHDQAPQCAFEMVSRVVAHALDYDVQVVPFDLIADQVDELVSVVKAIIARTLAAELDEVAWALVQQPTRFGGLAVQLPTRDRAAELFEQCSSSRHVDSMLA